VTKPTKQAYSFDFKLASVERFIAGETAPDLAAEVGLSFPGSLKTWARAYRPSRQETFRSSLTIVVLLGSGSVARLGACRARQN
jgi:transposase-like protein